MIVIGMVCNKLTDNRSSSRPDRSAIEENCGYVINIDVYKMGVFYQLELGAGKLHEGEKCV